MCCTDAAAATGFFPVAAHLPVSMGGLNFMEGPVLTLGVIPPRFPPPIAQQFQSLPMLWPTRKPTKIVRRMKCSFRISAEERRKKEETTELN